MRLTEEEHAVLRRYGFGPDDVFVAVGLPSDVWKRRAKEEGKRLILGAPCRKRGHRIRTRSGGHCFQCSRAALSFQERYSKEGFVYIAESLQKRLIKVGGTEKPRRERERMLRAQEYAGASDWQILLFIRVRNYGRVEHEAQTLLKNHAVKAQYRKDGKIQQGSEVFRCSAGEARNAVFRTLGRPIPTAEPAPFSNYDFR